MSDTEPKNCDPVISVQTGEVVFALSTIISLESIVPKNSFVDVVVNGETFIAVGLEVLISPLVIVLQLAALGPKEQTRIPLVPLNV